MRWILWSLGGLVALGLVVYVIGLTLPQSHVASVSARFTASPAALWTSLTNLTAFPKWRTGVTRVELLPDEKGQAGWREVAGRDAITYRVVEKDAPRHLVARIADPNLPYGGTWTYDLAPLEDGGTRVTITERGEVYNPIFRFVSRFFLGYTSTREGVLRALGTLHGESTAPEPTPIARPASA